MATSMTKFLCIFVLALSLFLCTGHVYGHSESSRAGSGSGGSYGEAGSGYRRSGSGRGGDGEYYSGRIIADMVRRLVSTKNGYGDGGQPPGSRATYGPLPPYPP
uniref:Glycine-rich protein n=1 Tax=Picea sitchensis TaxID=3332 RepID=C0PSV5_PICSI|nr:unknown [Picea sitchensis]